MSTFTQPQYTSRVTDGIGDNVSTNIRNKILLREYIDLAVLLNNSNSNNTHDNQKLAFINGELIVQQKQNAPKITYIETWTDAFIIYMNIYCSVHTEKFAQLLFTQLGWEEKRSAFGWKSYDEKFRLRLSLDPMASWETIDSELWLIYMYGHMGNQPNAMGKVLRCYSFNYNGQCLRQGSQYSHSCTRCFGQHPVKNCPRQNGRFTPNYGHRQVRPSQRMPHPRMSHMASRH